jgi:hypothetical protein
MPSTPRVAGGHGTATRERPLTRASLPVNLSSRHHVICHFKISSSPAPARQQIPIPKLPIPKLPRFLCNKTTHMLPLNLISVQNLTLIAFPFLSQTHEYLWKTLVDTLFSIHLYPWVDNFVNLPESSPFDAASGCRLERAVMHNMRSSSQLGLRLGPCRCRICYLLYRIILYVPLSSFRLRPPAPFTGPHPSFLYLNSLNIGQQFILPTSPRGSVASKSYTFFPPSTPLYFTHSVAPDSRINTPPPRVAEGSQSGPMSHLFYSVVCSRLLPDR